MKIYERITDLIGSTPLVRLGNYSKNRGLEANVIAKVEYLSRELRSLSLQAAIPVSDLLRLPHQEDISLSSQCRTL